MTDRQTESLLRTEQRELRAADGRVVRCETLVVVWDAFDELVRPPIGIDRFELIGCAISLMSERGEGFEACFESVVRMYHSQIAPPWSLRLAKMPRARR
ncbi:MAG: hypothetical protein ACF8LL_14860 [Phycisphaerales bacterium]